MAIGLNVTTWVWAQGGTHSTSAGGDQVIDEGTLGTKSGTPHGYSSVLTLGCSSGQRGCNEVTGEGTPGAHTGNLAYSRRGYSSVLTPRVLWRTHAGVTLAASAGGDAPGVRPESR